MAATVSPATGKLSTNAERPGREILLVSDPRSTIRSEQSQPSQQGERESPQHYHLGEPPAPAPAPALAGQERGQKRHARTSEAKHQCRAGKGSQVRMLNAQKIGFQTQEAGQDGSKGQP